ncbi:MAG: hypothetical protein HOC70_00570 [Gammaproteobacteria bacterium]|jgi:general stress protein 26|nr:hypothetical protein [Gammaproteobacteria bacterium]MBT4491707.1 hypothetical protein [Gammaproteobacteria bacterium]MBT7369473.1 hypothetical protein [Gammaproteobacteria bacterium]
MSEQFAFINYWNDHHPDHQVRYYNHLSEFTLDDEKIMQLMQGADIATVAWAASDGSARAIAVPFALLDDEVYFTAEASQPIVKSLEGDNRISMCWGGMIGAATARGHAEIIDDQDLTARVCEASAKQRYQNDADKAAKLASRLASPTRVSIKVTADKHITFSTLGLPRD